MLTTKEKQHKDPFPHPEKNKGKKILMNKNQRNYYNKCGHQRDTCWKLDIKLCPKKDDKIMKEPMKKVVLMQEPINEVSHYNPQRSYTRRNTTTGREPIILVS